MFNYQMQERKFCSFQLVSIDCLSKLMGLPPLIGNDHPALKKFSSTVRGAAATLAHTGYASELGSYLILLHLLNKLSSTLRKEWGKISYTIECDNSRPNLKHFDRWLELVFMLVIRLYG